MYLYDAMGKVKKEAVAKPMANSKNNTHSPKRKKNGDKRGSDEWNRKFGYVSPQSVKCIAESVGIPGLSDGVANNLAEDVSYRLRSIIQLCAKFLKHTRHNRLTCEDVNDVLQMCDVPPVLGHGFPSAPHTFLQIREPSFYILDDPVVDLPSYALLEVFAPAKQSSGVVGKWATPDEQRGKVKLDEVKTEPSEMTNNKQFPSSNHVSNSHVKVDNETKHGDNNHKSDSIDSEPRIDTNLIKYYGVTCNAILGHGDLKVVLRDLSRNGKIVPIIPYLLNFLTITLNRLGSERLLLRLLHTVDALTKNTKIDFTPYHPVTRVSNALLKIIKSTSLDKKRELIVNNLPNVNERSSQDRRSGQKTLQSYPHQLRCRAAQVLGKVLLRWCCSEDQRVSVVQDMWKLINDQHLPTSVHIGAVALINELGPDSLSSCLWPYLEQLLNHLNIVKQDKHALELELLNAAEILYRNPHFDEKPGLTPVPQLDQQLYEYFGDSLCCRRLQLTENPRFLERYLLPSSSNLDLKPDGILKRPCRLPKCKHSMYNPEAKRPTIHTAFQLPKIRRKRNPRIIFKFVGANPVPEMSLRRRRLDSRYSQFIAGKVSEGHVVLVGKLWRKLKQRPTNPSPGSASLFSIL